MSKIIFRNSENGYFASCGTIADALGVSYGTVTNISKRNKITPIKKGRYSLLPINDVSEFKPITDNLSNFTIHDIDDEVSIPSVSARKSALNDEIVGLKAEVERLKGENNKHLDTIIKRRGQILELEKVNKTNIALVDKLKKQIEATKSSFTTIQKQASEFEQDATKYLQEIEKLNTTIAAFRTENKTLQNNFSKEVLKSRTFSDKLNQLQLEYDSLNAEIIKVKAEYENYKLSIVTRWESKVEPLIVGTIDAFVKVVEKSFNVLNSNPATFVVLALVFAVWEGTYHAKVMQRPGLAIVIQLAAVLVTIWNFSKSERHRIAKAKNTNQRFQADENHVSAILIGLGIYNFSLTYLSFIHYTTLAGSWNTWSELFSHHGNYVAIGLSVMFAVIISGCINIYVKKTIE